MWDFVVDIVVLADVFTEYLGSPRQFSFHQPLHIPLVIFSLTLYSLVTDNVVK
jgi:hypothetical protein